MTRTRGGREREDKERETKQKEKEERDVFMEDETGGEGTAKERRQQRETWEGEEIDRGIRALFKRGTHVWPIEGEITTQC